MKKKLIDFVDFHTHILPSVDHGSDSLDTTLLQLKLAKEHGITKIFATSHFYPHQHTVSSFLEKRSAAYSKIIDAGIDSPEIKLGAEVLLCEGLHKLEAIEKLCISGTNFLLLELPFTQLSHGMIHTVKRLSENGFEVILAHADRYPRAKIEALLEFGVKIQLNADTLASPFRRKDFLNWFERGLVVGIGSDIHGVDKRIYKKFLKAVFKIGNYAEDVSLKSQEIWKRG